MSTCKLVQNRGYINYFRFKYKNTYIKESYLFSLFSAVLLIIILSQNIVIYKYISTTGEGAMPVVTSHDYSV